MSMSATTDGRPLDLLLAEDDAGDANARKRAF
jgi:hypothetical protein